MSTITAVYGDRLTLGRTEDYYGRADAFTLGAKAPDGLRYRVRVQLQEYTGDSYALDCAPGFSVHWGGPVVASDPAEVLDPLMECVLTVQARDRDGRLGFLAGRPDGYVRCVFEESDDDGATWSEVAKGYFRQGGHRDAPFIPGYVPLVFHDGIEFLDRRAAFGSASTYTSGGDEDVTDTLRRILGPLGGAVDLTEPGAGWEGMVTVNGWRPFLQSQIGATTDPLSVFETVPDAWLDDDDASDSQLVAVRALLSRFGLRLHQALGKLWVMQRDHVAADPSAVDSWTYDPDDTGTVFGIEDASTYAALDLIEDTRDWVQASAAREALEPVASATSTYGPFQPGFESLLLNGSFEDEGAGGATTAEYWTAAGNEGGGARIEANDPSFPFGATYSNRWLHVVNGYGPTEDVATLTQDAGVFLPATQGWELKGSWMAAVRVPAVGYTPPLSDYIDDFGGLVIKVGSHYLWETTVTLAGDQLSGDDVRVYIEPLFASLSDEVTGTPVIPRGAVLEFYDGTSHVGSLTLSETARVGQIFLRGSLSADVERGQTATAFYWKASAGGYVEGVGSTLVESVDWGAFPGTHALLLSRRVFATGVAPDGTGVSGDVWVQIVGPALDDDSNGLSYNAAYDEVVLSARVDGADPDTFSALVHRGTDAHGVAISLPVGNDAHPVGDGPLPDSDVALGAGTEITYQGADTGWIAGAYGVSDPSTEVGLEAFHATRALMQFGSGRQRIHATFLLGPGQRVLPQTVLRYWQKSTIVDYLVIGSSVVQVRATVRAGERLVLGVGTAREEEVTVDAVAPGAHGTVCTTSATAYEHYVDEGCLYSGLYLPDEVHWRLDTAEVDVSATELFLESDAGYLTELRLGRAEN